MEEENDGMEWRRRWRWWCLMFDANANVFISFYPLFEWIIIPFNEWITHIHIVYCVPSISVNHQLMINSSIHQYTMKKCIEQVLCNKYIYCSGLMSKSYVDLPFLNGNFMLSANPNQRPLTVGRLNISWVRWPYLILWLVCDCKLTHTNTEKKSWKHQFKFKTVESSIEAYAKVSKQRSLHQLNSIVIEFVYVSINNMSSVNYGICSFMYKRWPLFLLLLKECATRHFAQECTRTRLHLVLMHEC